MSFRSTYYLLLELTYHTSTIPWIYFCSAIIGYIQQLIFAFFWWNASVRRVSLIQCHFSAYFMIHGFLEAGDKFYGLFAPMVFIILSKKTAAVFYRVLAALFSSTIFLVQKLSCPLLCINVNWARIFFLDHVEIES